MKTDPILYRKLKQTTLQSGKTVEKVTSKLVLVETPYTDCCPGKTTMFRSRNTFILELRAVAYKEVKGII